MPAVAPKVRQKVEEAQEVETDVVSAQTEWTEKSPTDGEWLNEILSKAEETPEKVDKKAKKVTKE